MRERFLAGEDVSAGVRPEILLSWYRCRDDYGVDPSQKRASSSPEREPCQLLDEKVVVTQLAGLTKAIEHDVRAIGALVAITDGRGGILATWGDSATLWCTGFRDWGCAGVAMRDPVARMPLGVLGVSSRRGPLPNSVLSWLRRAQETIESGLREQALRTYRDLAAVYRGEARLARGPLVAADTGGRLLLANADARAYFGIVRADRPWELTDTMPRLQAALRTAVDRAHRDKGWVGVDRLPIAGRDDLLVAFRPAITRPPSGGHPARRPERRPRRRSAHDRGQRGAAA